MGCQVIHIPLHLFEALLPLTWQLLPRALEDAGLEITSASDGNNQCLAVSASYDSVGLKSRPLGSEEVLGLVIAPVGTDLKRLCWPRPLPEGGVTWLIDKMLEAIDNLDCLTAHDRIALAECLVTAHAEPPTGPRPGETGLLPKILLTTAQSLSSALLPAIDDLSASIERYRDVSSACDCEATLLYLSSQIQLREHLAASRKNVWRQDDGSASSANQCGELWKSINAARDIATATRRALRGYDPCGWSYEPIERVQQLASLHSDLSPTARRLRNVPRWRDSGQPSKLARPLSDPTNLSPLSPRAVPAAFRLWLANMRAEHWPGVHPLVRALMLHADFVRISPFRDANTSLGRLLLAIELQKSGWPVLPLEAAFFLNGGRYERALRMAIAGDDAKFFRIMLSIFSDAIVIGEKMITVIKHERDRLIEILADPRLFGPDASSRFLRDWAEEALRDILFERVARFEGSVAVEKLHRLGFLACSQVGGKALYSVPGIMALLASLPEAVGNSARSVS